MSVQSQEKNMRKLAELLSRDLSYIWGEREGGPNGDKKAFLKTGKTFLWNLSKDLKLCDAKISTNPGGIAVSGECSLIGLWNDGSGGIYIQLSQFGFGRENVLLYRHCDPSPEICQRDSHHCDVARLGSKTNRRSRYG